MPSPSRKFRSIASTAAASLAFWSVAASARAADLLKDSGLNYTATAAGVPTKSGLSSIIGNIIGAMTTMIGSFFIVLVIYGGFLYMTAQGSEEKVKRAKNIITGAIIGMVIIFSAYTITGFVIKNVIAPTVTDAPAAPPPAP